MPVPRAVAVVVDGPRALVIKRYLRSGSARTCVMCANGGQAAEPCPGHHYAVLPGGGVEDGETAEAAALRELREETTLTARISRLMWTGGHNGRPASYFLVADVRGTPVLSGQEALDHGPDNSFELRWAGPDELDVLSLHPPGIRHQLAWLLHSPSPLGNQHWPLA
jgi:ADP-ribose pyrophosphatase YjhB (NUDIX family)